MAGEGDIFQLFHTVSVPRPGIARQAPSGDRPSSVLLLILSSNESSDKPSLNTRVSPYAAHVSR